MAIVQTAGLTTRTPSDVTFATVVGKVMRSAGKPPPDTVESPSKHTMMATAAVNAALQRVWTATRWDWRRRFAYLDMEDKKWLYTLPGDFSQTGAVVTRLDRKLVLPYWSYEDITGKYPMMALADATTLTDVATVDGNSQWQTDYEAIFDDDMALAGIPDRWTIVNNLFGLFPVPWLSNVDADDYSDATRYLISYYGAVKDLSASTDVLDIPFELHNCHYWLATSYFKQSLEGYDAPTDDQRGERLLMIEVAKQSQKQAEQFIPDIEELR